MRRQVLICAREVISSERLAKLAAKEYGLRVMFSKSASLLLFSNSTGQNAFSNFTVVVQSVSEVFIRLQTDIGRHQLTTHVPTYQCEGKMTKFILSCLPDKFGTVMISELQVPLVCSGMATPRQKAFYFLRFSECESAITAQRDFRRTCGTEAPTAQSIRRWHQTFQESGCLCAQKR